MTYDSYILKRLGDPPVSHEGSAICIYSSFSEHEQGTKSTDEHVIPEGVGGNLILLDGSCDKCLRKIQKYENRTITGLFGATRDALYLRSKKKRKRGYSGKGMYQIYDSSILPRTLTELQSRSESSEPIEAYLKHPTSMPTYYDIPGILRDGAPNERRIWGVAPESYESKRSYTMAHWIHPASFERTLAKIAHAFAVYRLGVDGFQPFLGEIVLLDAINTSYLIGSRIESGLDDCVHRLTLTDTPKWLTIRGLHRKYQLYVVSVRLFGNITKMSYDVVVGHASRG